MSFFLWFYGCGVAAGTAAISNKYAQSLCSCLRCSSAHSPAFGEKNGEQALYTQAGRFLRVIALDRLHTLIQAALKNGDGLTVPAMPFRNLNRLVVQPTMTQASLGIKA